MSDFVGLSAKVQGAVEILNKEGISVNQSTTAKQLLIGAEKQMCSLMDEMLHSETDSLVERELFSISAKISAAIACLESGRFGDTVLLKEAHEQLEKFVSS